MPGVCVGVCVCVCLNAAVAVFLEFFFYLCSCLGSVVGSLCCCDVCDVGPWFVCWLTCWWFLFALLLLMLLGSCCEGRWCCRGACFCTAHDNPETLARIHKTMPNDIVSMYKRPRYPAG